MPHYRYIDHSQGEVLHTVKQGWRGGLPWSDGPYHKVKTGVVVFECDAADIIAADAALKSATGIDAMKALMVGCSIT